MCDCVCVLLLLPFSHRFRLVLILFFFSWYLSIVCTLNATCVSMFACIHQNKLTLIFSHFLFLASCCTLRITKISSVLLYTITSKLSSHTIYIPLKKRKIQVNTQQIRRRSRPSKNEKNPQFISFHFNAKYRRHSFHLMSSCNLVPNKYASTYDGIKVGCQL